MSTVTLTIDGREVTVPRGTTIFDAARMNGVPIPTLCHQQNQTPVGVCRVCVVDVGARVYAAACIRECDPGMVVKTNVEPVQQARKTLVELLMSDHPRPARVSRRVRTASSRRCGRRWPRRPPRRDSSAGSRHEDETTPRSASPSIMKPASSATAACADVTRSRRTTSSGAPGAATRQALPSI